MRHRIKPLIKARKLELAKIGPRFRDRVRRRLKALQLAELMQKERRVA